MEHSYVEEHNIAERYLLGKLSSEERMRFEEHFADCMQCCNDLETSDDFRTGLRTVIDDRYLSGKLSSGERMRFEERFADRMQRRDGLETSDDFRTGLRILTVKEALRRRAYFQVGQAGLLSRLARLSRARQAALLTGLILLIGLPMALLILEWTSARRDLAQARQTSSEWRRNYEEREQAARDMKKEMGARERQSSEQLGQLAVQLEREREERRRLTDEVNKAPRPRTVVPVFALSVERDGDADLSRPANQITLSNSPKLIILLLELESDTDLQSYRAALSTADGRSIWRESKLKPVSNDTLALSFNSSLFRPDNYLLTLERLTAQRRYVPIAQYTFRVLTQ